MLPAVLFGLALLVGGLLILRWFVAAPPADVAKVLKWLGFGVLAVIALFLVMSGRLGYALGVLAALIPWLLPLLRSFASAKTQSRMAGAPSGRTSTVETRFLTMSLELDSGELDGEVVEGPFRGRRLSELDFSDLIRLWRQVRLADGQSAQVLEAYLDRAHPKWRSAVGEDAETGSAAGNEGPAPGETMTVDEAYSVLGLETGASERDIRAAHHRLIALLHPDRGGSSALAAKVNQARDVLLKK